MKLQDTIIALIDGTIELDDGVEAILTRDHFMQPYVDRINWQQYVPTVNYGITKGQLLIYNTDEIFISDFDVFIADDWICTNARTT